MLERLFKTTNKALECSQNQRKYLMSEYRKTLEECVCTINQIQDVQNIRHFTETSKNELRNNIIDNTRTKLVTKLIELDNLARKSNS